MATQGPPPKADNNLPSMRIRRDFLDFLARTKLVVVPTRKDRAIDQLLPFRDETYRLLEGESFLKDLESAFEKLEGSDYGREWIIGSQALLYEVAGVARAIEVSQAVDSREKGWVQRARRVLLPKAAVVTGSLKDIPGCSEYAKFCLSILKEMFERFGAKK